MERPTLKLRSKSVFFVFVITGEEGVLTTAITADTLWTIRDVWTNPHTRRRI